MWIVNYRDKGKLDFFGIGGRIAVFEQKTAISI
jgi:hypothetical protein